MASLSLLDSSEIQSFRFCWGFHVQMHMCMHMCPCVADVSDLEGNEGRWMNQRFVRATKGDDVTSTVTVQISSSLKFTMS